MTLILSISELTFITLKSVATIVFVAFWIFVLIRLLSRGRAAYELTARLPLAADDVRCSEAHETACPPADRTFNSTQQGRTDV